MAMVVLVYLLASLLELIMSVCMCVCVVHLFLYALKMLIASFNWCCIVCTYTTIVQLYLDFSMSKFGQFILNMCFKRERKKTHNALCLPLCPVPSIRIAQQLVYFAPKNANVAIGKNAKMNRERQSRFQTKINYGTTNFILLFVLFISRLSFCSLALHVCVCARA